MAKGVSVKTPVVTLFMANIDKEDFKYHNYGTGFSLPADHEFISKIDEFIDDNFTKGDLKHTKFSKGYSPDAKTPGNVVMFCKSKHMQGVYDSRGRAIEPPSVGSGTRAVLSVAITKSMNTDRPGVILRYNGCQLVKLVEREGKFGDISGDVEDGYEADDEQVARGREMEKERRDAAQARKDSGDAGTGSEGAEGAAVQGAKANTDF